MKEEQILIEQHAINHIQESVIVRRGLEWFHSRKGTRSNEEIIDGKHNKGRQVRRISLSLSLLKGNKQDILYPFRMFFI